MTHTVVVNKIEARDPRLKRNVEHDSRSRMFPFRGDAGAITSARHWSATPVQDQGEQGGSCTGQSAVKNLTYEDFWVIFLDRFPRVLSTVNAVSNSLVAEGVYSDAEILDGIGPYPPHDEGSSGLSVAKALHTRGWISGYQHAFSFEATLAALSNQAVIIGTNWYTGMLEPTTGGEVLATGQVEGGHEFVLEENDTEHSRVWLQNSWGAGWGLEGRAWMSWDMLEQLLAEDGDCTIFTPLSQPAPVPVTAPEVLVVSEPEAEFISAAQFWIAQRHSSKVNTDFERQTQAYLDWLGTRSLNLA